jgi:hypothetical protein
LPIIGSVFAPLALARKAGGIFFLAAMRIVETLNKIPILEPVAS